MPIVAVTAPSSSLGERVQQLLAGRREVTRVVAVEPGLAVDELKRRLEGVDVVVDLAVSRVDRAVDAPGVIAETTRVLLDAAGSAGVHRIVLVSSATVYGAWPDNPVPLTEDAPLRPNPGLEPVAALAECERLVGEWRDGHPGATTVVLRPALVVGGREPWLSRVLSDERGLRVQGATRPVQYLHVDDLASAVVVAGLGELSGICNVAPDGWLPHETARALAGARLRVALPERFAAAAAALSWRLARLGVPPAVLPYTQHPWVVANDRLRAAGWRAGHSNEEAFVATRPGTWWSELSPKRRQELALGVVAGAAVAAVAGAAGLVRRSRRRGRG